MTDVSPKLRSATAPIHTPDRVADIFRQGKESENSGLWDAAGAMFRKCVEIGLKDRFPDIDASLSPYKRIQKAADENRLTRELAEWAHSIRALGNEAVHEYTFTRVQANEISAFSEILLQYMFTLPGELDRKRILAAKKPNAAANQLSIGGGAKGSRRARP